MTLTPHPAAPQHDPSAAPASYEAAVQELESLLARLESGQMPLDDLLGAYQRAAQLLDWCRQRLDAVEQQIRLIDAQGERPWEGDA
ncbi:Exodeoxyribonuclease 7 small subunit [Tepidimonas alkaliphilus]|uniref:Exodeoxyribonuclease 7 small subunit n=1 Tax=Tepidimonas alkaliphilus TaxID=2588942 RepID=A0A554WD49_9BURK|nr:exodeoxyribonuclease VII small subunit [Tepidimonas alkaliphilus]TSE21492.1 Exodeoxyribonuclease 7 small subunit [Tepidimonas alkaliphilus]